MPLPVHPGALDPSPIVYAHPPLVESWLEVVFAENLLSSPEDLSLLRAALGPEWCESPRAAVDHGSTSNQEWKNLMGDRALRFTTRGFSFGWLGYTGERYPRYETIRDGFVTVLDAVRRIADQQSRTLVPQQWSVRYVNQIPRGTVWNTVAEWQFFSLWPSAPLKSLGITAENFSGSWDFLMPDQKGNLLIHFLHDSAEAPEELDNVIIRLTARGPVRTSESGLFDGLDLGREVVVRSFNEIVSCEAKDYWGVGAR